MKAAIAVRRERRPGGGPERSEGIAVSPKGVKAGSILAPRRIEWVGQVFLGGRFAA